MRHLKKSLKSCCLSLLLPLLGLGASLLIVGCEQKTEAEEAVGEAIEEVGEAVEEAADQ